MAKKPEVKLSSCQICKKALASDVKPCIHCGATDPHKKEKKDHFAVIVAILIFLAFLLALGS